MHLVHQPDQRIFDPVEDQKWEEKMRRGETRKKQLKGAQSIDFADR